MSSGAEARLPGASAAPQRPMLTIPTLLFILSVHFVSIPLYCVLVASVFILKYCLILKKSYLAQNGFSTQQETRHLPTSYGKWLTVLTAATRIPVAIGTSHVINGTAALTGVYRVQLWAPVSSRFPARCLNFLSVTGHISVAKVIRMGVHGGLHAFPSVGQNWGVVHVP